MRIEKLVLRCKNCGPVEYDSFREIEEIGNGFRFPDNIYPGIVCRLQCDGCSLVVEMKKWDEDPPGWVVIYGDVHGRRAGRHLCPACQTDMLKAILPTKEEHEAD